MGNIYYIGRQTFDSLISSTGISDGIEMVSDRIKIAHIFNTGIQPPYIVYMGRLIIRIIITHWMTGNNSLLIWCTPLL